MRFLIFIILLSVLTPSFATKGLLLDSHQVIHDGGGKKIKTKRNKKKMRIMEKVSAEKINTLSQEKGIKKKTKAKAILMAVLTGPLGGHRLYLGTKPYVPIIYAVTLGGGFGLLPLIDIAVILLSKDTEKYYENPQIIMW